MPCRNERDHIGRCLHSLLKARYPRKRLEVLVVDGRSSDGTRQIVETLRRRYPILRLLDNPRRIVPAALNIGIRAAAGEIILRMDAHAFCAPDYIRRCVNLLETSGADSVGGLQRAVGNDYISHAIAIAMTTPFGAGDAHYRYAKKEMWVDTVYLGAWRKETWKRLGGFREDLPVNQDYEFNYRLRRSGGRILLSPRLRVWYRVRPSMRTLALQYFRYGFWRARTVLLHPGSLRWRHLAAPFLLIGTIGSLSLWPQAGPRALLLPCLYAAADLAASLGAALSRGLRYLPILPWIYGVIHFSWGIGFLAGLAWHGIRK